MMIWLCLLLALIALIQSETVYTVHYLRSYREDVVEASFGCSFSILYGAYYYPSGAVDALFALTNNMFEFNTQCQRKSTFIKLFGLPQQYPLLVASIEEAAANIAAIFESANTRKIVISWNYRPALDERQLSRTGLQKLGAILSEKGYEVYVKAPASLLCLDIEGQRYLLDLSFSRFIIELYGQQQGRYTTFQTIFAPTQQPEEPGYSTACPRYPSLVDLSSLYPAKSFFAEKTMDQTSQGYVGSVWEQWIERAGQDYSLVNFMDGFELQSIDL